MVFRVRLHSVGKSSGHGFKTCLAAEPSGSVVSGLGGLVLGISVTVHPLSLPLCPLAKDHLLDEKVLSFKDD